MIHIFLYTAHLIDRVDDPAAGCFVKHVEDLLTQPPALHEQAFKSHGVSQKSEPEQMAVDTAHLHPDRAQIIRTFRHFHAHHFFHSHTVTQSVAAAADTAYTLRNI